MFNEIKKVCLSVIFIFYFATGFASVPHNVNKYNFHIDLPDGFTRMVEEEDISQWIYDSYHGNYNNTKQVVHVRIQKQDVVGDYVGNSLKTYRDNILAVYKQQQAKIISFDIIKLTEHEALILRSVHDGKEHLSLQMYDQTMYTVTVSYDEGDKQSYEMFDKMMLTVKVGDKL